MTSKPFKNFSMFANLDYWIAISMEKFVMLWQRRWYSATVIIYFNTNKEPLDFQ